MSALHGLKRIRIPAEQCGNQQHDRPTVPSRFVEERLGPHPDEFHTTTFTSADYQKDESCVWVTVSF